MQKRIYKFLGYFLLFFSINLVVDILFKDDLNIVTAFSVALGVSGGIVYFGPFLGRKFGGTK